MRPRASAPSGMPRVTSCTRCTSRVIPFGGTTTAPRSSSRSASTGGAPAGVPWTHAWWTATCGNDRRSGRAEGFGGLGGVFGGGRNADAILSAPSGPVSTTASSDFTSMSKASIRSSPLPRNDFKSAIGAMRTPAPLTRKTTSPSGASMRARTPPTPPRFSQSAPSTTTCPAKLVASAASSSFTASRRPQGVSSASKAATTSAKAPATSHATPSDSTRKTRGSRRRGLPGAGVGGVESMLSMLLRCRSRSRSERPRSSAGSRSTRRADRPPARP